MKRSKAYIARKPVENPPTAMGSEANRSASGSIENATVASRTPLANPSANDTKSVVGVTQSATRPSDWRGDSGGSGNPNNGQEIGFTHRNLSARRCGLAPGNLSRDRSLRHSFAENRTLSCIELEPEISPRYANHARSRQPHSLYQRSEILTCSNRKVQREVTRKLRNACATSVETV